MCGTYAVRYCSAWGWPICLETDKMRPVHGRFGPPSLYSLTHQLQRKTLSIKLSVTSSSLPESLNVGEVMGLPTTIISVIEFIKSPYFEVTTSTMPKNTTKSSGLSASNAAKLSAYISATMREIRSVGNAPTDFVMN
eukprot:365954-Chlamydomonas_euryale.AAC.5